MPDFSLRNCRVLVVEDEYMLAHDLVEELGNAGAVIIGPVGRIKDVLAAIDAAPRLDGAVLDINLHGKLIYPAADLLAERNVPFIFVTGYDGSAIPDRYGHIPRCEKPLNIPLVTKAIGRVIHA